ncbi:MAG: 2-phosphosulfolactate phosphatase [Bacteroidales bacterium]|jgi:2-phosphosulfolactate phosphatase|nr:2-phosphosulfolactate phosphatase [Bacteroidales bacterium]
MPQIDICPSPVLYPAYHNPNAIVVVVDVFRATSSMCIAFANGAKSIIPVETVEEARKYKKKGYLVAAERDVVKCDFADFGNSPYDFSAIKVDGNQLIYTTTNGTRAILAATGSNEILIGSFLNLSAVAFYCLKKGGDILVLCAGWNGQLNMEDTLYGGALANLVKNCNYETKSDTVTMAIEIWNRAQPDIRQYVSNSEHVARLQATNQGRDIAFCLQQNLVKLIPRYVNGQISC